MQCIHPIIIGIIFSVKIKWLISCSTFGSSYYSIFSRLSFTLFFLSHRLVPSTSFFHWKMDTYISRLLLLLFLFLPMVVVCFIAVAEHGCDGGVHLVTHFTSSNPLLELLFLSFSCFSSLPPFRFLMTYDVRLFFTQSSQKKKKE